MTTTGLDSHYESWLEGRCLLSVLALLAGVVISGLALLVYIYGVFGGLASLLIAGVGALLVAVVTVDAVLSLWTEAEKGFQDPDMEMCLDHEG